MKKILFLFFICTACMLCVPNIVFAASVPSAPTIKSFTANSSSSITIKWGSVSGATKYKITRSYADESDYKTLTSSCTSTSYTDTGLKACGRYYYRVYAINSAGTSARSTTYRTRTKPETPVISSVSRDSSSQLTINWDKVSGATKYKLVYRRGDQDSYTTLSSTLTGTSYTHTGLKANSKYFYRVYAIIDDSVGPVDDKVSKSISSEHSETFGKWTLFPRPSVSPDATNTDQITLTWKKAYGGSEYAYDIYRKAPGSSSFTKIVTQTQDTTYVDTGLNPGYIYAYKINTVTTEGSSCTWTDVFYAGTKITEKISVTPYSATAMYISWNKPTSVTSGLVYRVGRWNNSTEEYDFIGTTSSTAYIDSGLTTGETYKYYIQLRDSSDNYLTSTRGVSAVLQILPTGITLDKTATSVEVSGTLTLTATISPSNSTSTDVTWTSSDTSVAAVSSGGVVTPKAEGTTVITAKTSNSKTASCTVTVTSCSHTYGDWVVTAKADCETNGSEYRVCSKCGFTETTEISASGHSYGDRINKTEATCGEDGIEYRICNNCGKTEIISVSATGEHSYGEWSVDTEATCIEEGSKHRECSVCGAEETEIITVTDHSYELTEDVPPTISKTQGTRTYTCSVCGDSYTENYIEEIYKGTISAESQIANPGDTVNMPVYITDNPGISAFTLKVEYDKDALSLESITKGELLSSGSFNPNIEQGIIYWYNYSAQMTDDGELFVMTFDIAETASESEYTITISYDKTIMSVEDDNDNVAYVNPSLDSGVIKMQTDGIIKGDVNLDNTVDSFDQILLGRYCSNWNITFSDEQMEAADVYTDGFINTFDGIRLALYFAGYSFDTVSSSSAVSSVGLDSISLYGSSPNEALPEVKAGSCEGAAGYYVDVPVSISNNSGIAGFKLTLSYDNSLLTPVSVEGSSLLHGGIISNLQQDEEDVDFSTLDYVTAYWVDEENMIEDGVLFTVRFSVNDTAEIGDIIPVEISCNDGDICVQDLSDISILNEVNVSLSSGDITVVENIYSTGDINGDGNVDKTDAALLLKHLSGISELSDLQLAAADYNSDSSIDMLDVIGILQSE